MDIVDRDIADAERDASSQWLSQSPVTHTTTDRTTSAALQSDISSQLHPLSSDQQLRARTTQCDSSLDPRELDRIATYRILHTSTVGTKGKITTRLNTLQTLGAGKPFPPKNYDGEDFLVEFEGHDDPLHPQNWAMRKRYVWARTSDCNTRLTGVKSSTISYTILQYLRRIFRKRYLLLRRHRSIRSLSY
jgi:DHA1 family multidrug resistance protein-like MFS transporter